MNNFSEQAVAAAVLWQEMLELMQQEYECWRMFGYIVTEDFLGCVCVRLP